MVIIIIRTNTLTCKFLSQTALLFYLTKSQLPGKNPGIFPEPLRLKTLHGWSRTPKTLSRSKTITLRQDPATLKAELWAGLYWCQPPKQKHELQTSEQGERQGQEKKEEGKRMERTGNILLNISMVWLTSHFCSPTPPIFPSPILLLAKHLFYPVWAANNLDPLPD